MTTTEITTEDGSHSKTIEVAASTVPGDIIRVTATGIGVTEYTVTHIVTPKMQPRNGGTFAVGATPHTTRWFRMV